MPRRLKYARKKVYSDGLLRQTHAEILRKRLAIRSSRVVTEDYRLFAFITHSLLVCGRLIREREQNLINFTSMYMTARWLASRVQNVFMCVLVLVVCQLRTRSYALPMSPSIFYSIKSKFATLATCCYPLIKRSVRARALYHRHQKSSRRDNVRVDINEIGVETPFTAFSLLCHPDEKVFSSFVKKFVKYTFCISSFLKGLQQFLFIQPLQKWKQVKKICYNFFTKILSRFPSYLKLRLWWSIFCRW